VPEAALVIAVEQPVVERVDLVFGPATKPSRDMERLKLTFLMPV
jgi:hypothetical protein